MHTVFPGSEYVPGVHWVHVESPTLLLMVPAGQSVHGVPSVENLPAGQFVHMVAEPATVVITPLEKVDVPAVQSLHVFGPSSDLTYLPNSQYVQALLAPGE